MDERAVVDAVQSGDEPTFTALVERHRGELQVHCYRMLGSLVESEDLVQETFLRAAGSGWPGPRKAEGRLHAALINPVPTVLSQVTAACPVFS